MAAAGKSCATIVTPSERERVLGAALKFYLGELIKGKRTVGHTPPHLTWPSHRVVRLPSESCRRRKNKQKWSLPPQSEQPPDTNRVCKTRFSDEICGKARFLKIRADEPDAEWKRKSFFNSHCKASNRSSICLNVANLLVPLRFFFWKNMI